jgi:hypothetical protein
MGRAAGRNEDEGVKESPGAEVIVARAPETVVAATHMAAAAAVVAGADDNGALVADSVDDSPVRQAGDGVPSGDPHGGADGESDDDDDHGSSIDDGGVNPFDEPFGSGAGSGGEHPAGMVGCWTGASRPSAAPVVSALSLRAVGAEQQQ